MQSLLDYTIRGALSTRGHAAPRTARGKIPGSRMIARQPSGTETWEEEHTMEHRRLRLVGDILVALLVLLAAAAPLQAVTTGEEFMRFTYWTGCSPLRLGVAISEDAVTAGLTEESVATAVRSRLRSAWLYTDTNDLEVPMLIVHVSVSNSRRRPGGAFSIEMALYKHLYDPLTGLSIPARTNDMAGGLYGKTGMYSGNTAFILSGIAQAMDGFLDAYLRVNEPACPRSPIDP